AIEAPAPVLELAYSEVSCPDLHPLPTRRASDHGDNEAVQSAVDAAEQALRDALAALTVDKSGLADAIADATALTDSDYSEASWADLQTALTAADAVNSDNDAVQSAVDAAEQALRDALAALTVDKSRLADAIADATALTDSDYSEASWADLQTALTAADALHGALPIFQSAVDAAEQALRDALAALTVDKSGLADAIAD